MRLAGRDPLVAAGRSAKNGLMIAFGFTLPYHVMRAAAAAGIHVHVIGGGAARGLARSRYCRGYHETLFAGDVEVLLAEIADLVRTHAIDVVFPSDDVSTRLLAALGERLPVPTPPLPTLATFDLLNDKWNFSRFCRDNGIRAPEARLFDTLTGLHRALENGEVALPITVKPTNRSGGIGVIHIREAAELKLLDTVDYRPILVQRHVRGEAVSITLQCDHGRMLAHVAQQRDAARFQILADRDLLDNVTWLATLTQYHGTANFDAVLSAEDGRAYLVECNPRFWYSIYLVMLAGLNFIDLAIASPAPGRETITLAGGQIRLSLRKTLLRPWRASRLDWKFVRYCLGDPVAFALQRARSYDDSEVAVPVEAMAQSRRLGRPATV